MAFKRFIQIMFFCSLLIMTGCLYRAKDPYAASAIIVNNCDTDIIIYDVRESMFDGKHPIEKRKSTYLFFSAFPSDGKNIEADIARSVAHDWPVYDIVYTAKYTKRFSAKEIFEQRSSLEQGGTVIFNACDSSGNPRK